MEIILTDEQKSLLKQRKDKRKIKKAIKILEKMETPYVCSLQRYLSVGYDHALEILRFLNLK